MTPELKPVKGMVVLKFLTDDESDTDVSRYASNGPSSPSPPERDRTSIAQVIAAGPDTNVKKGQVVMVRSYAREAPEIDDDTVITDAYCILAVVATA